MDFDRLFEVWQEEKKKDPFYEKAARQDLSKLRRTFRMRVWKGRAKTHGVFCISLALCSLSLWLKILLPPSMTVTYLLAAGLAGCVVTLLQACLQWRFKPTPIELSMAEFYRLESRRFEGLLRWYRNGLWILLVPSLVFAYLFALKRTSDPVQIAILVGIYAVVVSGSRARNRACDTVSGALYVKGWFGRERSRPGTTNKSPSSF